METDRRIKRIAVLGGGAAGWSAAAMLNRKLGGHCSIHVVDEPVAMSLGQAEATLPSFLEMLRFLGIDQNDFVDKTQSTYSLGARFTDWRAPGESFWHAHGALGALIERRPFYHFWHKARTLGLQLKLEMFSQEASFAQASRFIFPTNAMGIAPNLRFGLHLDVALYVRYLRSLAERAGVVRLERAVVSVTRHEDGRVDALQFDGGGSLHADLFIDCSGEQGRLIGETLGSGWQDWSRWLPCDREIRVPGALTDLRPPHVQIHARAAGWQWRMPLQQVVGHGLVYASAQCSDEAARQELLSQAGEALAEPEIRTLRAGRRSEFWRGNVVSLGLAAGSMDPLATAGLHLVNNALLNLLDHFPDASFDPANIASYNAIVADEYERIRDFVLAHYCLSRREEPFWQQLAAATLPDSLTQRIAQYRATGRIVPRYPELFSELDWFWIFEGLGVVPRDYDPLVDTVDFEQVKRLMLALSQKIAADTGAAPSHDSFFAQANARLAGVRKAVAAAKAAG